MVAAFSQSTAETTTRSAEYSHERPTYGVLTTGIGEGLPMSRSCKRVHPELQAGAITGISVTTRTCRARAPSDVAIRLRDGKLSRV